MTIRPVWAQNGICTTEEEQVSSFRAAVMPGNGAPLQIREFPEPSLEIDSALMKVELSEVCGTDVHLRHSRLGGVPYPIIPGHVSVGTITKLRGTMNDVHGVPFSEGDRITFLDVHRTCNQCYQCLVAKSSTRCPHRKVYGITYGVEDGLTGGWAEAIYLKPGTRLLRLGESRPKRFMAGGCALPTALHAIERAAIVVGDRVLVLGSGPVGLAAVILARMSGASAVFCIGAPDNRLAQARQVGADDVLNFAGHPFDDRLDWILAKTGGIGPAVVIEATGAPQAVTDAMRLARDAGRVVVVGQYTDNGDTSFNPHLDLNRKHLDVRGCWGSDFSHFFNGVELMADESRSAAWDVLELNQFGLADIDAALDRVESGSITKALVNPEL